MLGAFCGIDGYVLGWRRWFWICCRIWHMNVVVMVGLKIRCEIKWALYYYYQQSLTVKMRWFNSIHWYWYQSYFGRLSWFCCCQLVIFNQNRCGHMSCVFIDKLWGWGGNCWYGGLQCFHLGPLLNYVLCCPVYRYCYCWCFWYWVGIGDCWLFQMSLWISLGWEDVASDSWLLWYDVCSAMMRRFLI